MVNIDYKYDDDDVYKILGGKLDQFPGDDVVYVAPCGHSKNELIDRLAEEKRCNGHNPNRVLLIPYLKHLDEFHLDGHWVGIVVRFNDNVAQKIEYYDSFTGAMPDKLRRDLKQIYSNDIDTRIFEPKENTIKQNDLSSCGPCMIQNLVNAAKSNYTNQPSVREIRQQHIDLMGQNFYEKQLKNNSNENKNPFAANTANTDMPARTIDLIRTPYQQETKSNPENDKAYLQNIKEIATDCIVITDYTYVDDDVDKIFEKLKADQFPGNDVFYVAPCSDIEIELLDRLAEEERHNGDYPNRVLLIPCFSGSHIDGYWVGIVVRFNNNVAQKIEYYDSLSGSMTDEIRRDLKRIYGNDVDARIFEPKENTIKQNDISSCGPCMIQNLVNAAKSNYTNQPSAREIRQQHIDLMGQNFYEKQLKNNSNENKNPFAANTANTDEAYLQNIKEIALNCIVNTDYKYDHADVDKIFEKLKAYQFPGNDVFYIAPKEEQKNELIEFLVGETDCNGDYPNRVLLIPYFIGSHIDGYWVGIVVRFNNNVAQKIEYYDSSSGTMTEELKQDLKQIYGIDVDARIFGPKENTVEQKDFSSCGPCMIQNLVNAAKSDYTNQPSVREIRQQHIDLMGQNFYEKQLNNKLCVNLTKISKLFNKMSYGQKDKKLIRNVHGVRNASNNNEKNTNGAKLDFDLLSHLDTLIEKNDKFRKQLEQQAESIRYSLKIIIEKIDCISQGDDSHNSDLGFLGKIIAHYHDIASLQKLLDCLKSIDAEWFRTLNPNDEVDRRFLGYFFVELGTTAREITDFVQPQKTEKNNLIRELVCKLWAFRNILKNSPESVRTGQNPILFQMKIVMEEMNSDLRELLEFMLENLKKVESQNMFSNFHEFDSEESKLSKFEKDHEVLIVYVENVLQIAYNDLVKQKSSIEEKLTECAKKLQKIQQQTRNFDMLYEETKKSALDNILNAKKKLLKINYEMVCLILDESKLSLQLTEHQQYVVNFVKKLVESVKTNNIDDNLTKEQKALIKMLKKARVGGKVLNVVESNKLKETLSEYRNNMKTVEDMINDESVFNHQWLISKNYFDEKELNPKYMAKLINNIKNEELKLCLIKRVLKNVQKKLKDVEDVQDNDPKDSLIDNDEPDRKAKTKVIEIIGEIKFLQSLLAKPESECNKNKLIPAAKMSLGLIGQLFKEFERHLILEGSYFLENCDLVIKVRNQEIMHNAVHSTLITNNMLQLIKNRVVPWYRDFIAILIVMCTNDAAHIYMDDYLYLNIEHFWPLLLDGSQMRSAIYNLPRRYFNVRSNRYEYGLKMQFKTLIVMVAYNRLLKFDELIKFYHDFVLQTAILGKNREEIDDTISVAIKCEVALAYRNLWKHEEEAEVLKSALENVQQIEVINPICKLKIKNTINLRLRDAYKELERSNAQIHIVDSHIVLHSSSDPFSYKSLVTKHNFLEDIHYESSGHSELDKSLNELLFIKYFDSIKRDSEYEFAKIIISSLVIHYDMESDIESVLDCFRLDDQLNEYFDSFITSLGQRAISLDPKFNIYRPFYEIIFALISQPEECREKLEEIYSYLKERTDWKNSSVLLGQRHQHEFKYNLLKPVAILLEKPPNDIDDPLNSLLRKILKNPFLKLLGTPRRLKSNYLKQIIEDERAMKDLIVKLEDRSTTEDERTNIKFKLMNLRKRFLECFKLAAAYFYAEGSYQFAKELMSCHFLYVSIIDFLKSIGKRDDDSEEFGPLTPKFKEKQIQYLRTRFEPNNNVSTIITRYENTKSNVTERERLIKEYEKKYANAIVYAENIPKKSLREQVFNGVWNSQFPKYISEVETVEQNVENLE